MKTKDKLSRMPFEFENWIKNLQKQLYNETNELFSRSQIMRMLSKSRVNVKKKGDKHEEISFGF